jgi:hypothetical protein
MNPKRITIIPSIHGKITRDGKMSEPDIYWILDKWKERHPEIKGREKDIRIVRGTITLRPGIKTDLISVSIVAGDDIAGYDPAQDEDLYAYYVSEQRDD